ncbi:MULTISPECIES: alpha-E domain-containing protein [Arthrobacter]|uniref:alpha-E domain-containing protein n=1 Tax=Arthrobacter TaxID=1663 RepID=UPI00241E3EF2|nr:MULTISPECIES: alpha-E domain-containing protein [Arthrobacter]MDQ0710195.1 putative alpha-E superfamily protein [Arthrobacter woluwensis]WFR83882.1 alpha-E domain-containing protein [Arthrobacter sp. Y-9]
MLSRIAESLFWIGRYVERADGTARILDVHLERLNHLPPEQQQQVARDLLQVMGSPLDRQDITLPELLRVLAYDRSSPTSIAGALGAARENARRARETVSTSLWECLNTTYFGLSRHREDVAGTYRFCQWVIERAATTSGLTDSTMSHDDSWLFMVLGRSLERADMTARMLATCDANPAGVSWVNMLRCAGAYESFLRTRRAAFDDRNAAEFLLMDRQFPRSIVYSLKNADEALALLEPSDQRSGMFNDARRIVGQARTFLEFHRSENLMDELPEHMERIQRSVARASEEIARRYYSAREEQAWVGELS